MLVLSDEPVGLRERTRALAAVDPGAARWWLPFAIAAAASEASGPALGPETALGAHGGPLDLDEICVGYRRELWLWLVGERSWGQCVSGLMGRISRRAEGSAQ
jgi:hypothetical protein